MSDATAAAILAGLTSWYTFDSTLADAKGVNTLNANLTVSGYSAGKKGNKIDQGSRASVALASPIAFSTTTGQISVGGWLTYDGINTDPYIMGLVRHLSASTQEVMSIGGGSGVFSVVGWKDNGLNTYDATAPDVRQASYPVTVRVNDAAACVATSPQIIRISSGGTNPAGTYFVVATWDNGTLRLYVDSTLVATTAVTQTYTSPIAYFQIGAVGYGLSSCGIDEAFVMGAKALSQAEIDYLYNAGAGRSYAELTAAAA